MKKLLGILVLGLLWCNVGFAIELYCKVENAFRCNADCCKKFESSIFINLDTDRKIYQRGDSQGMDTYEMEAFNEVGTFRYYVLSEKKGGAFIKLDAENNFVEVVHLGLVTVNNFGKCK